MDQFAAEASFCLRCWYEQEWTDDDIFTYLDALRDSGETNLWGARA